MIDNKLMADTAYNNPRMPVSAIRLNSQPSRLLFPSASELRFVPASECKQCLQCSASAAEAQQRSC